MDFKIEIVSLVIGILAGAMIAMLFFGLIYGFSFGDMAYKECSEMLRVANIRLAYCNDAIISINDAINNLNHSMFALNSTSIS